MDEPSYLPSSMPHASSAASGAHAEPCKGSCLSEARDDMRLARAGELLASFARRTGIHAPGDASRRYVWTDAFAVQALLALARATGETRHRDDAFRLVALVHLHLGTHRSDDPRVGRISGLDGSVADLHPTLGGLRIGKPLPERSADMPYDERVEWERDGQYYHYLTRWVMALISCARAAPNPDERERHLDHARELAHAMHAAFVVEAWPGGPKRIRWKMSIDLTRPQIEAYGLVDMIDGFATFATLEAELRTQGIADPVLAHATAELRAMCDVSGTFATVDPLSLGGLLLDTARFIGLVAAGAFPRDFAFDRLVERLLLDLERGLEAFDRSGALAEVHEGALERRLGFRELGLAIGLQSIGQMRAAASREPSLIATIAPRVDRLARHLPLVERIERTWLDPRAEGCASWLEHIDIHEAMLAACLLPEVVLEVMPSGRPASREVSGTCAIAVGASAGSSKSATSQSSVRGTPETL